MRVLMLNKFLYRRGGAETQMLELGQALVRHGYEVAYFGTYHPENCVPRERSYTFPCPEPGSGTWRERLALVWSMFTGDSGRSALARALREFQPDVVHAHNVYHQIGCALLPEARSPERPLLLTVHDYKLVCPTYNLFDGHRECFACKYRRFWNAPLRSCHRMGRTASTLLAAESFWAELQRFYQRGVDRFIVPSRYVRQLLVQSGIPRSRTFVLPNAVDLSRWAYHPEPGEYFLYLGRLSREKGVNVLLEAVRDLPDVRLKIAGRGPLEATVRQAARELPNVEYLGDLPRDEVPNALRGCRAVVLPTTSPENCPMVLIEAFATGRPAVATSVGGVPELFESSQTPPGLVVAPGDADALREALLVLAHEDALAAEMGRAARELAQLRHNLDSYLETICRLYRNPSLAVSTLFEIEESQRRHGAARSSGHVPSSSPSGTASTRQTSCVDASVSVQK